MNSGIFLKYILFYNINNKWLHLCLDFYVSVYYALIMLLSIAPFNFMVWTSVASFWILLQIGFLNYLNKFLKTVNSCIQKALLMYQRAVFSALLQEKSKFFKVFGICWFATILLYNLFCILFRRLLWCMLVF